MQKEPVILKIVRLITIGTFVIVSMMLLSGIDQSPSPVFLMLLASLYIVPAVGLARRLAWSYWPTKISLLLLAFYWSGSLIDIPEGELNDIQKMTESMPQIALWIMFIAMWACALMIGYILNKNRDYFQRKWL